MQKLSEPLNKYLLKLVNAESDREYWKNYMTIPIPKVELPKKVPLSAGIYNMIREFRI